MPGEEQKAGWWDGFKKRAARARDWLVELALVVWICRVSVVSTALGIILFIFIPQVRDTFLEIRKASVTDPANIVFWVLFLLSALFLWALPVHYAARRDLRNDPAYAGKPLIGPSLWFPRILALACLMSIAIGAYRAQFGFLNPTDPDHTLIQTRVLMGAASLLSIGLFLFLWQRRKIFTNVSVRIGTLLMTGLTVAFLVFFLFNLSAYIWRAPLIPLLLGGWVPIFAWLAYEGRQYRLPFILLLFLALEGLAWFGDNHDVRRISIDGHGSLLEEASTDPVPKQSARPITEGFMRETIKEAIARWQEVNGCPDHVEACPRPIVVAASGGASRAGFFTAGVLGELMDRSKAGGFSGIPKFRNRLFAISTVSGSSTGAAFFTAALHRAQDLADASHGEVDDPPCRKDRDELVYFDGAPQSWRECMEQLLAGDFISPTLFGLVYNDAIRGVAPFARRFGWNMRDRAVLLEASWEDRFCLATEGDACHEEEGMRAPYLSASGRGVSSVYPTVKDQWLPILLLNGTDVETGRRVVVSPLNPTVGWDQRLFPDAYDLHDLLVDRTERGKGLTGGVWDRPQQDYIDRDIRLSTAALLSARFPVISPPGNILNEANQIIARIIDGGYFENYGAATAADIVAQLKDAKLEPFVIEITNDPESLIPNLVTKTETSPRGQQCGEGSIEDIDPLKLRRPPIVDAPDHLWFSDVTGPVEGLLGSRGAQGGRALRRLSDLGPNSFLHIYVKPLYVPNIFSGTCEVADVSMSWWLSKQVQKYLDAQIDKNCRAIDLGVWKARNRKNDTALVPPSDNCVNEHSDEAQ